MRQTSIEVFNQIRNEGLLSKRRFEVYQALFQNGPMTQVEVAASLPNSNQHSITPRFAELEKSGAIRIVDKRECKITGRIVLVWDVTDKVPEKYVRSLSPKIKLGIAETLLVESGLLEIYKSKLVELDTKNRSK